MAMQIPENWNFKNKSVADNFDNHVAEQLPWYHMAQNMAAHLLRSYLGNKSVLLDVGCSTGGITKSLKKTLSDRECYALSLDISQEMIDNFDGYGDSVCCDAMSDEAIIEFDACCVFLTLMFLPVKDRFDFIQNLIDKANKGGVIIIVDKVEQIKGYLGTSISRMTLSNKLDGGANPKEILEKELSLCGAQRPIDSGLLEGLGFIKWFQAGDFAGWAYEKR